MQNSTGHLFTTDLTLCKWIRTILYDSQSYQMYVLLIKTDVLLLSEIVLLSKIYMNYFIV